MDEHSRCVDRRVSKKEMPVSSSLEVVRGNLLSKMMGQLFYRSIGIMIVSTVGENYRVARDRHLKSDVSVTFIALHILDDVTD